MTDPLLDRVYIVIMNPRMVTFLELQEEKEIRRELSFNGCEDDALGAINNSFGMGSVVK